MGQEPDENATPAESPGPSKIAGFALAVLGAAGVVATADVGARLWLDRGEPASSYVQPRNPRYRADWVRYTEPREKAPDELRIVVIGDSMGFMPELPRGDLAYTTVLRDMLTQRHAPRPVSVMNWSVPGTGGHELAVLAARALDHDPDLVIVTTYYGDFDERALRHELAAMLSDATALVYRGRTRERLSPWFKGRFGAHDPYGWAVANSGLFRVQRRLLKLPGQQEFDTWDPNRDGGTARKALRGRWSCAPTPPDVTRLLREFPAIVAQDADAELLFVEMPVWTPAWAPEHRERILSFGATVRAALDGTPRTTFVSAIDLLTRDMHYSGTHVKPEGHRIFAEWLLPHVERQLR